MVNGVKMKLIKTEDEQGVMYSLSGDNLPENYVLSDKNCQDIERGYDLDELADECQNILIKDNWRESPSQKIAFTLGFQKALEILGDKDKKNIELLKEKLTDYFEDITDQKSYISEKIDDILQQTEWEVEILTHEEFIFDPSMGISQGHYLTKEILDSKGRLILKNI
jgi:hypothetical protein